MVEARAFGETLKRAREERGVSLDAVASATRIARHHLEALERGDLESLPGGPFGRSYLRSYAEFLGIDPEPILVSYRAQEAHKGLGPEASREKAIRELSQLLDRKPKRKPVGVAPAGAAAAAVCALVAFFWIHRADQAPEREIAALDPSAVENLSAAMRPVTALPEDPDPDPEPAPPKEPPQPGAITVSESALGTDVVNHTVTGRGNRFSEGERVAFWTRVLAAKPGGVIHHYWIHEGRAVMRADLSIGGPHWRTFSRFTLPAGSSGTWVVEARDETGRVLAREEFLCLERGG